MTEGLLFQFRDSPLVAIECLSSRSMRPREKTNYSFRLSGTKNKNVYARHWGWFRKMFEQGFRTMRSEAYQAYAAATKRAYNAAI